MAAITYKLVVSKKGDNKKYVEVGKVDVPVFPLSDFGLDIEPKEFDKETGLPVYDNPKVQFVFDSIFAATKANARNKLVPESASIKPGLSIASTVEELIQKGDSGAALALLREFYTSFETYLKTKSGKKEAVVQLYSTMAKNKNSIALAQQAKKDGFAAQLSSYLSQATDAEVEKFSGIISNLIDLTTGEQELDDDDL